MVGENAVMRRRITRLVVTAVVLAVLLFAVPLAVVAHLLIVDRQFGQLQRAALTTAARVDGASVGTGDPIESPVSPAGVVVTVLPMTRGSGGPVADPLDRRALTGTPARAREGDRLVAVVPVVQGEIVLGVVRASSPTSVTWWQTVAAWTAVVVAAAVSVLLAWLVSRRQVRGLVRPVEQLAVNVDSIGRPGIGVAGRRSGLPEVDTVARALADAAARAAQMRRRERSFGDRASHQLRTPIAGLELVLEEAVANRPAPAWDAIQESLGIVRRLEQTVDDVLRFTRPDRPGAGPQPPLRVGELAAGIDVRWRSELARAGRSLDVTAAVPARRIAASPSSLRQALDVLLDNALRHGRGPVSVEVRDLGTHVAIDVADAGSSGDGSVSAALTRDSAPGGMGLDLARDMVEQDGGRLVLSCADPTTVTVLIPAGVPSPGSGAPGPAPTRRSGPAPRR